MIGYAMCGSFCTHKNSLEEMERLVDRGWDLLPVMSSNCYSTDTRFGKASDLQKKVREICGKEIIHTITEAEELGPKIKIDALIISPCTGNTLAKIALGITDTSVTMAAKAHLRNCKPLVIALATNDALSANLKNIGILLDRKNVYFVPMIQDEPTTKPTSMIADFKHTEDTLKLALEGKQLQPVFLAKDK